MNTHLHENTLSLSGATDDTPLASSEAMARYMAEARRMQSRSIIKALASLGHGISYMTGLGAIACRLRRLRMKQQTAAELKMLDQDMLDDIGVGYSQIESLASDAAKSKISTEASLLGDIIAELRSGDIHTPSLLVVRSISYILGLGALVAMARRHRIAEHTYRQLKVLDTRELDDIGLSHVSIPDECKRVARQVVPEEHSLLGDLVFEFNQWREKEVVVHELEALGDRLLDDIGMRRTEIEATLDRAVDHPIEHSPIVELAEHIEHAVIHPFRPRTEAPQVDAVQDSSPLKAA